LLDYTRHFALLLALAVGLVGVSRFVPALLSPSGVAGRFALYGAAHALTLVLSLTPRPSARRQVALVAAAAAMSAATAWLTVALVPRLSSLSGPGPMLAAAAALGAWAYASTIRRVLRTSLGAHAAVWISLACAAAVAAAYPWVKHLPSFAGLGLAISWWLAFSAALASQDAGRRR
jgi:hypothetical protein